MQLRMESSSWRQAHAFFSDCLALDPSFAPAWAELGRLDRVLGKYGDASRHAEAQASLARALSLDPGNGAAQCYYAQLDIDRGRVDAALGRLLDRAGQQRAEPAIYAALVHACRYAGLLEASLAADMRARHLDPTVTTSVLHTFYMAGDYRRALDEAHRTSDPLESRVLAALGLDEAAIAAARREETRFAAVPLLRSFATALRAALENRAGESVEALAYFEGQSFSDGEGLFYVAEILARLRQPDRARALLERACAAGFVCLPAFESSPCLTSLHAEAWWSDLAREVRTRSEALAMEFATRGGTRLLG
jgi:tetratricopeptide (TPR) repeat protein